MLDFYNVEKKPPPEFVADEEDIESLLYDAAQDNLDIGYEKLDEYLGSKKIENSDKLQQAIILLAPILSRIQTPELNEKYTRFVGNSIYKGAMRAGAQQSVDTMLLKQQVQDGIVSGSSYYTNKFFNTIVTPKVEKAAMTAINDKAGGRAVYDEVRKTIDDHYGNVKYWRLVANVSASRSFNYGVVKGGIQAGYSTVRWDTQITPATCGVCLSLNGTTWDIYEVANIYERACTGDPEDVKDFTPWLTYKEIEHMSEADLLSAGVPTCPRHPSCHCVLNLV